MQKFIFMNDEEYYKFIEDIGLRNFLKPEELSVIKYMIMDKGYMPKDYE